MTTPGLLGGGSEVLASTLNFLLAPPIFLGRQTSVQAFTTGVDAAVNLDTEDYDTANGHSTSSNTSRYTAVYAGYYWLGGGVSYAANATGGRATAFRVNGAVVAGSGVTVPGQATLATRVPARGMLVYLNVGDYVEIWGYQSSGGNLNTAVTDVDQPSLSVHWISR